MTLAVCVPVLGLPSETFIRRHVERLAPGRTVVIARRRAPAGPGRWDTDAPVLWLDELSDEWGGRAERDAVATFLREHGVRAVLAEYLDVWLPFLSTFGAARVRTVAHAHGYDVSARLREEYWRNEYLALAEADAVVTMSARSHDRLLELGLPADRLSIVPYGVDLPGREREQNGSGTVGVLSVGRLVGKKAPLLTLAAFRAAAASHPELALRLVGDGPLMAEARAAAAGLDVELTGAADNDEVLRWMAEADVFCQHSIVEPETGDEEGLPVAVLEAMAHGLPVVSTRHAGIPDAVAEGVSGFLVEEQDVDGMAACLTALAADPELRARMGAAGQAITEARFSWPLERDGLLAALDLPSRPVSTAGRKFAQLAMAGASRVGNGGADGMAAIDHGLESREGAPLIRMPERSRRPSDEAPRRTAVPSGRVRCDGKFFAAGDGRFPFRGVTYGTFKSRGDGALFPEAPRIASDMEAIAEAGFTVVRTYTPPPDDLIALAGEHGLRIFAGAFFPDWRYALGCSRSERRMIARDARTQVRAAARRLAGNEVILAVSVGNEIPADVVRWVGSRKVAGLISDLVDEVHDADADLLATYANYPTAEYLPLPNVDFLTFNVFLERREDFRGYLTRLHHLAGDRPLVLGEVGLDAGQGAERQAEVLDWQLEVALERGLAGTCVFSWTDEWAVADRPVEGWSFGITDAERRPRPALDVARRWNGATLLEAGQDWPAISVVVCAHNAEATIDECLRHACGLDYPDLEIVVVDDGSTDATAEIARRHPRARLVELECNGGLSAARNAGYRAATGDLIAFLDADAFPTPEWPYLLARAFDSPTVGAAGGPNVPPIDDPLSAQSVARAPGGPVHVLIADNRAEHVPGCNLAAWRIVLDEVGGFDPVYTAAGDDVDLCWKVLDKGWDIGFHPAASVWHRRRPGARAYARQQRGYGRAEALVQARHPDRFTPAGTARWRGSIYDSFVPAVARQRVYRGAFGAASYQSVYRGGGHLLDLVHQIGVPLAVAGVAAAPLGLLVPGVLAVAAAALAALLAIGAIDAALVEPPRTLRRGRARFRAEVAVLHVIQPLMRLWGRLRTGSEARRELPAAAPLPGPVQRLPGGVLLLPLDRAREDLVPLVLDALRRCGFRVATGTGWEDYDAKVRGSALICGHLVTSAHPDGTVQMRVRPTLRFRTTGLVLLAGAVLAAVAPAGAALVAAAACADASIGLWRTGRRVRRVLVEAVG